MANEIQVLKREAGKLGATVEKDEAGRYCCYQVLAPEGKQWVDNGASSLRIEWVWGDSAWRIDAIQEALNRMAAGLEGVQ